MPESRKLGHKYLNIIFASLGEQCPHVQELQVPNMALKNSGLLELATHCLDLKVCASHFIDKHIFISVFLLYC